MGHPLAWVVVAVHLTPGLLPGQAHSQVFISGLERQSRSMLWFWCGYRLNPFLALFLKFFLCKWPFPQETGMKQSSYNEKLAARWPPVSITIAHVWVSLFSQFWGLVSKLKAGQTAFLLPLILPAVSVGYFLCHFISQTIVFYCWKMCVSFQWLGITHTCHWV